MSTPKVKVLFVCSGNTCRSPMCEVIFRNLCRRNKQTGVMVRSAGTDANVGAPMMPEAVLALQEHGEKLPKKPHRAQQYHPRMEKQFDYIFDVRRYPDPYQRGQAAYSALCVQLQTDLSDIFRQIFLENKG